jgi:hypothetical protein
MIGRLMKWLTGTVFVGLGLRMALRGRDFILELERMRAQIPSSFQQLQGLLPGRVPERTAQFRIVGGAGQHHPADAQ